jgi:hypothetical protein
MTMTDPWWPTEDFVTEAAQRVGIVGRICISPDESIFPPIGGSYSGMVDGVHQITMYPRFSEHLGIVVLCHELVHIAQAQYMGQGAYWAWGKAEQDRVGNTRDGALEAQAYEKGEELAASFLPDGALPTYRKAQQ